MAESVVASREGHGLEMSLDKKTKMSTELEREVKHNKVFSMLTAATPSPAVTTTLTVTGSIFGPAQPLSRCTQAPHTAHLHRVLRPSERCGRSQTVWIWPSQ